MKHGRSALSASCAGPVSELVGRHQQRRARVIEDSGHFAADSRMFTVTSVAPSTGTAWCSSSITWLLAHSAATRSS